MSGPALELALAAALGAAALAGWLAHALWSALGERARQARERALEAELGLLRARLARAEAAARADSASQAGVDTDAPAGHDNAGASR